jgi:hypothetical protein
VTSTIPDKEGGHEREKSTPGVFFTAREFQFLLLKIVLQLKIFKEKGIFSNSRVI